MKPQAERRQPEDALREGYLALRLRRDLAKGPSVSAGTAPSDRLRRARARLSRAFPDLARLLNDATGLSTLSADILARAIQSIERLRREPEARRMILEVIETNAFQAASPDEQADILKVMVGPVIDDGLAARWWASEREELFDELDADDHSFEDKQPVTLWETVDALELVVGDQGRVYRQAWRHHQRIEIVERSTAEVLAFRGTRYWLTRAELVAFIEHLERRRATLRLAPAASYDLGPEAKALLASMTRGTPPEQVHGRARPAPVRRAPKRTQTWALPIYAKTHRPTPRARA
ncbi:MAG: hypothetical protein AAF449_16730 [Myxococcota bacterium]